MATLTIPYNFTNGTSAVATEVNQNFLSIKSFGESAVVQVDGSVQAPTAAIANLAVTTGKIADGAITQAKLAAGLQTAKTIAVGTTTTGSPGTSGAVTVAETATTATLSFTVPRGATGATGAAGANGSNGATGATGSTGPAGPTQAYGGMTIGSIDSVTTISGGNSTQMSFAQPSSSYNKSNANFLPETNALWNLGGTTLRWTTVYATNGTISTSDRRLKKDIVESQLGLDFINKLEPVSYRWINGGATEESLVADKNNPIYRSGVRTHYGLIAQQVKEAVDESGVEDFGGYVQDDLSDPDSSLSLNYGEFISPMIKAIKELSAKVDTLEARLAVLEAK